MPNVFLSLTPPPFFFNKLDFPELWLSGSHKDRGWTRILAQTSQFKRSLFCCYKMAHLLKKGFHSVIISHLISTT